jgi:ppGpp synthetase/RelA/SpoT-type nucleotidyltranferase
VQLPYMAYLKPIYSREDVNLAGHLLAGRDCDLDGRQALTIINNWRSSHSFPLNAFHVTLRQRARKVDARALTAQRLKRLPSIALKLTRFPAMRLTQMQDLGGCRAVLKTIADVDKLVAIYKRATAKNPKARHEFLHHKDYISEPKDDGYRSYHMIYRYRSKSRKHQPYNGLKIEIQIRTKLQHAWATAVEIVSTFTGQALKSNIGDDSWKRFFKLMSNDLAFREGRPPVPDTPTDRSELRNELRELADRLHVVDVMTGCGTGLQMMDKDLSKGRSRRWHTYLMILDSKERSTRTTAYPLEMLPQAQHDYLESEKENNDKPWVQSVLVSVDSVAALRRAYPNFFLDSMAFLGAVEQAIGESNGSKPKRVPEI